MQHVHFKRPTHIATNAEPQNVEIKGKVKKSVAKDGRIKFVPWQQRPLFSLFTGDVVSDAPLGSIKTIRGK